MAFHPVCQAPLRKWTLILNFVCVGHLAAQMSAVVPQVREAPQVEARLEARLVTLAAVVQAESWNRQNLEAPEREFLRWERHWEAERLHAAPSAGSASEEGVDRFRPAVSARRMVLAAPAASLHLCHVTLVRNTRIHIAVRLFGQGCMR